MGYRSLTTLDHRRILDALPDAVVASDAAGAVVFRNMAAEQLLGPSSNGPLPAAVGPDRRVRLRRADGSEADFELHPGPPGAIDESGLTLVTIRPIDGSDEAERRREVTRYLQAVTRAAARLGSRLELEPTLSTIVDTLTADFGAARASLWLQEADSDALQLAAEAGVLRAAEGGRPDRIETGNDPSPLARVVRTGQKHVRNGLIGDATLDADWLSREGLVSNALFPLQIGGRLLGVLVGFYRRELPEEVVEALAAFAAIAASSIHGVQLLARQEAARLQAERERVRLQTVLDTIPVGVVLAEGPEGRPAMLNPAGRKILGRELTARTMAEYDAQFPIRDLDGRPLSGEDRPLWRSITRGEKLTETVLYRRPDGEEVVLEVGCAPFYGEGGGAVSTYRDVTERRRLENELAERAGQLKALLDHLPVGVMYFDGRGVCRAANGAARTMIRSGRPRSGITGMSAEEGPDGRPHAGRIAPALPRKPAPPARADRPLAGRPGGEPGALPRLAVRAAGGPRRQPARRARPDRRRDRPQAGEAELQAAMLAAETTSRNKTRFLSAVSHDLRTPVNAISLLGELLGHLVAGRDDPGGELNSLAGDIRQASGTLIELINDLLELSRFESGGVEVRTSAFALDDWLLSTLKPLEVTARAKGLAFCCVVDQPGRTVFGDRVKLGRVLTNLVGNAVKFTEHGRVDVWAGRLDDGRLAVRVVDTGPGIPEDQRERIFDEFAQLQNPERDRTKGTGLGLAICRRLVEAVGGSLTVEGRPGVGSAFTAYYPPDHLPGDLKPESSAPRPAAEAPPAARGAGARRRGRPAQPAGGSPSCSAGPGTSSSRPPTAPEALAIVERVRPSLVLLDLMMPGIDGLEVLRRLRAREDGASLPVLVLSGDVADADRLAALEALGIVGRIPKPVDFDTVLDLVARHSRGWEEDRAEADRPVSAELSGEGGFP